MSVTKRDSGQTLDGKPIVYFDIGGPDGISMTLTNYGGIITRLLVPDRSGELVDVVLGFDELNDYFDRSPYFGALVGRYANRIDGASFELDGTAYQLDMNKDGYQLHGGSRGFSSRVFDWKISGSSAVTLIYDSPDGEQGFPGNLHLEAEYSLAGNELRLAYTMESDKDTVANITNHSYFNLSGAGSGDVLDHEVTVNADAFTESDPRGVPTGKILEVEGTPMDFRQPHPIGERIHADYGQLAQFSGYDHNYVLNDDTWCASAYSPRTGIRMDVTTTMPGVQLYVSCNMSRLENAKEGATYDRYGGVCFETQMFPDTPHHDNFPTCVLRAGERVTETTVYRFSIQDGN